MKPSKFLSLDLCLEPTEGTATVPIVCIHVLEIDTMKKKGQESRINLSTGDLK